MSIPSSFPLVTTGRQPTRCDSMRAAAALERAVADLAAVLRGENGSGEALAAQVAVRNPKLPPLLAESRKLANQEPERALIDSRYLGKCLGVTDFEIV